MLIDWFTVAAQILNFLILIGLLKYFLYGPIIRAMDDREQNIARDIEEAQEKKKAAEREAEDYRQKKRELDEKVETIMSQARQEAESKRKEDLEKARQELEENRKKWKKTIEDEKESLLGNLRRAVCENSMAVSTKVLSDLADEDLQQRMADLFMKNLNQIDTHQLKEIRRTLGDDRRIAIRSVFEISDDERNAIRESLSEQLGTALQVEFEHSGDLVCGLEIGIPGQKMTWNFRNYLDNINDSLTQIMNQSERAGQA